MSDLCIDEKTKRVAMLNDNFRKTFLGGLVSLTHHVQNLDGERMIKLMGAVKTFDDFSEDNDPYGEHDFGSVVVDGQTYFWKIDYYNNSLDGHSPDKSCSKVTRRVLTIMHCNEY